MGVQGSFASDLDDGTGARFDAIVGAQAAESATARPARLGLAPRERRRRAAITLTALLGGGALVGATLLVGTGTLTLSPPAADQLAKATTPLSQTADTDSVAADAVTATPVGAAFGSAVTVANGVTVLVSQPAAFVPSRRATGATQAEQLVFTVTVTNTGTSGASPAIAIAAKSGSTAASLITDVKLGLQLPGTERIEAGAARTFRVAFSAASSTVALTVTAPSGRTATFTA